MQTKKKDLAGLIMELRCGMNLYFQTLNWLSVLDRAILFFLKVFMLADETPNHWLFFILTTKIPFSMRINGWLVGWACPTQLDSGT